LATTAPTAPPPNIVFILADDLGWSDLGCYGGEIPTPNLDRLAKHGLRFTQFYNCARCWPTRAALLTGYYPQQVRRDLLPELGGGSNGTRPTWARLLPEFLRPLRYRSYHSGKWHIDGRPRQSGFDHSFEIGGGQNNYFKATGITDDGQPASQTDAFYVTTATADHAIRCLREHAEKFGDRPFFHYLAFTAPHFPLHAPAKDIARHRQTYRKGWNVIAEQRYERIRKAGLAFHPLPAMEREIGPPYHFPDAFAILGPGETNRPVPWMELTDAQREFQATKMAIHAAMIDRMDREIGRVLAQIRKMGAWDNTLILFASDNGASAEIMVRGDGHDPHAPPGSAASYLCLGPGWSSAANTPFRRHKTWVHEGGIATPFIVHWPTGIPARGELRHTPAHVIDFVPTVLELVGATKPATWDGTPIPPAPGRSLVPALARDVAVDHPDLWWLHEGNRAIRVRDFKLVAARDEPWRLYDLATDRGELNDLAARRPDLARELERRWTARLEEFQTIVRETAAPNQARVNLQPPGP
jgi:arylsulfatase